MVVAIENIETLRGRLISSAPLSFCWGQIVWAAVFLPNPVNELRPGFIIVYGHWLVVGTTRHSRRRANEKIQQRGGSSLSSAHNKSQCSANLCVMNLLRQNRAHLHI